ncbi:cutinase [Mycobacterium montefiorense]|uniref:Cutinase n=2 Tax=Mycobacterium montefiorense TaxID=154654 RepID=A0AA37PJ03_9MYCO|nr:cutinase family protein [Mycobacterium montefiorense]GBG37324.1 cutinase [Mycobacterium montefiorense]GKU35824.1 cutinase [Mycobacterium montefiorense]GKU39789.1 cutinase [Mycobacterium montefiorense]GKU47663.1 cutinase [Mycobacterium montefiorense]GKU48871.1 cutinase [Mycobacterium montefiorense]
MGTYFGMIAGQIIRVANPMAVVAVGLGTTFLVSPTPSASAEPCPDAQVVFARGTGEPEGVGPTGQAFVDNLRGREGGKSVDVYAVNYPASNEWETGVDGIRDASNHVISMAGSCPKTKMVLGGFSQGAAVMGFVTSAQVPDGVDPATVPKPLAPEIADHVAAVVLFGTPNVRAMNFLGQPPLVIGPTYAGKTIKVCANEDPVCSDGMNFAAHDTYADDGSMIDKGVSFAVSRLDAAPGAPAPVPHAPTGGFGN